MGMRILLRQSSLAAALAVAVIAAPPALGETCRNTQSFEAWLSDFKREAAAEGISRRTIENALGGVSYDPRVIKFDRQQSHFSASFLDFAGQRVSGYRLKQGRRLLEKHKDLFARIEQRFGVPGPVIVAVWGMETDFGAFLGDFSALRSLATLAYDCRRPEIFRPQLKSALKLIENGDLRQRDMVGAWAGELGQTQFMPQEYLETAVDFDGDGRRDLINSTADVLASTAHLLQKAGWHAGEPWLEEVEVPGDMPWDQADLAIDHPRAQWAEWGVTYRGGRPLPRDAMEAALLLPMGRNGPAFLAYRNFTEAMIEWNNSLVNSLSAAYFATRLAGAPRVSQGRARIASLSFDEIKQLQRRLEGMGYDVGGVDGTIGAATRAAVKDVQTKLGLPPDSYPTRDLLRRLR